MRLGRIPHSPEKLATVPQHVYGAAAPAPAVLDRRAIDFTPGLYGNDLLPDCTAVSLVNAARAFSWVRAGCDINVDPTRPPALYAEVVGVADDPQAMEATDGAELLDVIARAEANGYDIGEQVALVPLANSCDIQDRQGLAQAMVSRGALVLGVNLSVSDKSMGVWSLFSPPASGDPTPGSWGGHALIAWDYTGLGDDDLVRLGTWGSWKHATWAWVHARTQEAYALKWPQLAPAAP